MRARQRAKAMRASGFCCGPLPEDSPIEIPRGAPDAPPLPVRHRGFRRPADTGNDDCVQPAVTEPNP